MVGRAVWNILKEGGPEKRAGKAEGQAGARVGLGWNPLTNCEYFFPYVYCAIKFVYGLVLLFLAETVISESYLTYLLQK